MTPAIDVQNVSVRFLKDPLRQHTLKHFLASRRSGGRGRLFTALDRVTVRIEPGEIVGIVGRNGSGKSTLLRVMSGILPPVEGRVAVGRRVTPLLELGIGFHPDLSGRENCYVSGALLGLPPAAVARKLDAILAFSELAAFIDEPVRNYSSGMYARLAFALAMEVEPELLLLDEILGVGDEFFLRKCLFRMQQLIRSGVTTVLVSHNLDYLVAQCSRLIWLDEGRVAADGAPGEVAAAYRSREGHRPT